MDDFPNLTLILRTCLNLAISITSQGHGKAGFPQCIGAAQLQTEANNVCKWNSHIVCIINN